MAQKIGQVRIKAIELRKKNPTMTLQAIATQCGVTKQRIHKIFKDENIRRVRKPFPNCSFCGIMLNNHTEKFCSTRCELNKYYSSQPCATCGTLKKMRKYILRYKLLQGQYNFYCNRQCYDRRNIHINKIMEKASEFIERDSMS